MSSRSRLVHELKTWSEYYGHVESGSKTFEIRLDDRDFQEGDFLMLQEWDPKTREYTGRWLFRTVTYRTPPGCSFVLDRHVVLGMRPPHLRETLMAVQQIEAQRAAAARDASGKKTA